MLAVMLLASCDGAASPKFALSWFPWLSWYSAGIGMEACSSSSYSRFLPSSYVFLCTFLYARVKAAASR